MSKESKDYGTVFWLHIALTAAFVTSPFWLDWQATLLIALFQEEQYRRLGGCILTKLELGSEQRSFWHYYLVRIFPRLKEWQVRIFIRYDLPTLVLSLSLISQVICGHEPKVHLW